MALIFADPGGEYYFSINIAGALVSSIWNNQSAATITSSAPAGRATTFAIQITSGNNQFVQKNFSVNYSHIVWGWAFYLPAANFNNNQPILQFKDLGTIQTDLRTDSSGRLFFTRNGTAIGSTSSVSLTGGWNYIEVDILFATGATGTAQCWLNGVQIINATSVQTAATANAYMNQLVINTSNTPATGSSTFHKDIYLLDATTGTNTTHFGDVSILVKYPTTAGVNTQWTETIGGKTPSGGTLTVTAVTQSGGNGVFTFSDTGLTTSQLVGYNISVTGSSHGANNITLLPITASTSTTFTVAVTGLTNESSVSLTATPQNLVQDGINKIGSWPDGDSGYIADSTAGHISDFGHESLSLTGTLFAVVHASYVRKDDGGSRSFRQVCISGGTTETNGVDISATNSYLYYFDNLDQDPQSGGIAWTAANYNAATFGVKEIT